MTFLETIRGVVALLFFQSSWSYVGRQGLGLKFVLLWVARAKEQRRRIMEHCHGALNTNPFAAGALIGTIIRAEYDVDEIRSIDRYAAVASTTLAGGGDRFFWRTLRPAAGALAVLLGLYGSPFAPLGFLIPFVLLSQGTRALGLRAGYRLGRDAAPYIQGRFDSWARQLGWFSAGVTGMIFMRDLIGGYEQFKARGSGLTAGSSAVSHLPPAFAGISLIAMLPATGIALFALYKKVSPTWLLAGSLLILLLVKVL
jgi:mannose/fructose/N-acetylgalactosamine-specific phosphotransferase system component IID